MAVPEQRIAGKLRQQFQQAEARPHQLLREFQRYKELVKRPLISKELVTERYQISFSLTISVSSFFSFREMLLGQLSAHIKMIKDDFSLRTAASPSHLQQSNEPVPPTGKNMPQVVNTIVWVRQLEAKVRHLFCSNHYCTIIAIFWVFQVSETLSTAESLLGDLSGFSSFRREGIELKDELHEYQREQFDSWSRQILTAIDSRNEPLW